MKKEYVLKAELDAHRKLVNLAWSLGTSLHRLESNQTLATPALLYLKEEKNQDEFIAKTFLTMLEEEISIVKKMERDIYAVLFKLMMNKIEIHKTLCDQLNDIYSRKNADYGDSFAKVRREVPNAILVRLMDKMERIKTLLLNGERLQVADEKVDDTLLDLANYCLMEVVERRNDKEIKNVV